jgi:hypothetical protein
MQPSRTVLRCADPYTACPASAACAVHCSMLAAVLYATTCAVFAHVQEQLGPDAADLAQELLPPQLWKLVKAFPRVLREVQSQRKRDRQADMSVQARVQRCRHTRRWDFLPGWYVQDGQGVWHPVH